MGEPEPITSDSWFCTNCGVVDNVSTVGEVTCLEWGDIISEYR